MRGTSIIIAAALSLLLFASCNNANPKQGGGSQQGELEKKEAKSETKPAKIEWQEGNAVAVAFLGYFDSYPDFKNSSSYADAVAQYPMLKKIDKLSVDVLGDELYLIVPRETVQSVAVNEYSFDMFMGISDGDMEIYYKGENAPFLMKCNHSDSFPNTMMVILADGGKVIEWSPSLNINSGSLETMADNSVLDITTVKPVNDLDGVKYLEKENTGLSAFVKNGRPVVVLSPDWGDGLGFGDPFVLDEDSPVNKVESVNGLCTKVFIADIGQDYNPTLCALMADGTVKTMSLFGAMYHGDLALGATIPGISNVKDFESMVVEDEDGYGVYVTIAAITPDGGKHEIPTYIGYGNIQHDCADGKTKVIHLTQDWKLTYSIIKDYEVEDNYLGTFWPLDNDDESVQKYGYSFNSHFHSDGETYSHEYGRFDGTFYIVEGDWNNGIDIKPMTGLDLGEGMKKAALYSPSAWGE